MEVNQDPVRGELKALKGVQITDAREDPEDEALFEFLVREYHYLGYHCPVGQNMKYLIRSAEGRVLGCLLFGAAAWKVSDRDRFIGWEPPMREKNLNRITNNTRFVLLPWVEIKNLASHVLSRCLRRLNRDWRKRYGSGPVLVESFVDRSRYAGTCYQASNWQRVGVTQGRGRQDATRAAKLSPKDIYIYPLMREFRRILLLK